MDDTERFFWMRKYHSQGIYPYICTLSHSLILLICPAGRLGRKVDRWYSEWTTNEWMAGWMTNLSSKKRACMHIRIIMNKMKAKDNIKNKTSQNKQKRPLTPWQTGIVAKPLDNFEMNENVKVGHSTVLLRYISSFLLFSLLKREVKLDTFFNGIIVDGRMK